MRVLFYLPVITPWWFDHIVAPLIGLLANDHDVHVMAPPPWRNTGIGQRELAMCAHLPQVHWHICDGEGHETMRTEPVDPAAIIDFVRSLAPDYVLCRSADCATVAAFPGVVRHLMEGGAAPLSVPNTWVFLQQQPFDHGLLPPLDAGEGDRLDALIAPVWDALSALAEPAPADRQSFRAWADLPADRPILALPLEYEHEENFFLAHRIGATPNHRLIAQLADSIDDRFILAVTNHPLNELLIDNSALEAEIASHAPRIRLLPGTMPGGANTTMLLARDADGMLVGDSKVYALAGFFGTPMLRRSRFATGDWLNACADLPAFLAAVAQGTAARPDRVQARLWFAFHIANQLFDPSEPAFTAQDLFARLDRPVDPARWDAGFARYRAITSQVTQ
ncbi:hypothetical protein [Sphingomonas sp. 37zxx]|uniref:hypothetical protein n=1 Tax=Sphingomonas sp. 37zxx TaxID=1550073 RepID=UPI00053BE250|nr:hypothetical protein [Sphingomonas sp. 37zxx]